ncbi:hypothetical protein CDAR_112101 [Caerostris darwini]|uniref:Uncharacterized protein n=1 Tax=Caerostris darwini TaxID=1538125 RepID=A0AAV4VDV5_9ARAC|nr:hypothetical protein CDAR_112101 [Caerostris darwini]
MTRQIKGKLTTIQRYYALQISKVYRTSPTTALLTITGLEPLHLVTQRKCCLTLTCMKSFCEEEEKKRSLRMEHPSLRAPFNPSLMPSIPQFVLVDTTEGLLSEDSSYQEERVTCSLAF